MLVLILEKYILKRGGNYKMACERIDFLGVPIDILKEENIETTFLSLLNEKKVSHIIFLSTWDLLKARRRGEFRDMIMNASLVLPTSKSIIKGCSFLKKTVPYRHNPFDTILYILNVVNSHYKSLYVLGATHKSLLLAEENVRTTFTELKFVGRYNGYHKLTLEPFIISAIVKAHPSLVLVGNGIRGGNKWIYRNREKLSDGIYIHDTNIIDIFSKYKRKTNSFLFKHGLEYLPKVLINPLKVFTIFKFLYFKILILVYKIKKK